MACVPRVRERGGRKLELVPAATDRRVKRIEQSVQTARVVVDIFRNHIGRHGASVRRACRFAGRAGKLFHIVQEGDRGEKEAGGRGGVGRTRCCLL